MLVRAISVTNLRSFSNKGIEFSAGINTIYGANGSGKSTILEAVSFFSHGKSFVTHNHRSLIRFGADFFSIKISGTDSLAIDHELRFHFSNTGIKQMKFDHHICPSVVPIIREFPAMYVTPQSFRLLEGAAKDRRSLIDWLGFYLQPTYSHLLRKSKKVLMQRNLALRSRDSQKTDLPYWTKVFVETSHALTELRENVVKELEKCFVIHLERYLPDNTLELSWYQGWPKNTALVDVLQDTTRIETTTHGAHKFDLLFMCRGHKAAHVLSRGEKKRVVLSLYFSLLDMANRYGVSPLMVIDDLGSELDEDGVNQTLDVAKKFCKQIFVTTIHKPNFSCARFVSLP